MPLPVPLLPDVSAIHDVPLEAVHVHVLPVETLIAPEPALGPTVCRFGEMEYEQAGGFGQQRFQRQQ